MVLAAALVDHFLDLQVDGLAGLLVAAFILKTGWEAAKDTLDPLLAGPWIRSWRQTSTSWCCPTPTSWASTTWFITTTDPAGP